jgi:mannose-6-phosphate isomerase-like protein (cupin superfamily)
MSAIVVLPGEGESALDGFVVFKLASQVTQGSIAILEHHLVPELLAGPPHIHPHEDEISYILEGTVTVQLGDKVIDAPPGTIVFKPRHVLHAFWNQGTASARLLEIITLGGFEGYFRELHSLAAGSTPSDLDKIIALAQNHGLSAVCA